MDSSQTNPSPPSEDRRDESVGTPTVPPAGPRPSAPCVRDKVRFRFKKSGRLRLLSHHDLMRCFERLLRRACLPYHHTQGFHPHPRLVFALSLPLGVVGLEEIAELELDDVLPLEEIHQRLAGQTPEGLDILSVERIGLKTTAQVRGLCYRLAVPADRVPSLRATVSELLAMAEVWLPRGKPPPGQTPLTARQPATASQQAATPRVNVRPFLRDLRLTPAADGAVLEIDLWLTPAGTARPVEMLGLLGLTDLLEAGTVLERARLELHDDFG